MISTREIRLPNIREMEWISGMECYYNSWHLKEIQKNSNDNNINKKKESTELRKIARDAIQGATL